MSTDAKLTINNDWTISIQENKNGTFGKMKKIKIPWLEGLKDELVAMIKDQENGNSYSYDEVKQNADKNITVNDRPEEDVIETKHHSLFSKKWKIGVKTVIAFVIFLFGFMSVSAWRSIKSSKLDNMTNQEVREYIAEKRIEREENSSRCSVKDKQLEQEIIFAKESLRGK